MIVFMAKRTTGKTNVFVAVDTNVGTKVYRYIPKKGIVATETIGKLWEIVVLSNDSQVSVDAATAFALAKSKLDTRTQRRAAATITRQEGIRCYKAAEQEALSGLIVGDFLRVLHLHGEVLAKVVSKEIRADRWKSGIEVKISKYFRKSNVWTAPKVLSGYWKQVSPRVAESYQTGKKSKHIVATDY